MLFNIFDLTKAKIEHFLIIFFKKFHLLIGEDYFFRDRKFRFDCCFS